MAEIADDGNRTSRRSAGHNAVSLLVGQTLSRLVALAFYIVLARLLGPGRYGDFGVGMAFGTLLAVPLEPGLNPQLIREGARNIDRRRAYAADAFRYKAVTTPLAALLMVLAAWLLGYRDDALTAIALVGSAVLVMQIEEFAAAALAACERLDVSGALRLANKLLTAFPATVVAVAGAPFDAVCLAFLLGAVASALLSLMVVHLRHVPLWGARSGRGLRAKIRMGLPLALSSALWMLALRLDQAMASLFGVPVEDIGGYNAVIKLKEALIMFPAVVGLAFTPVFSRHIDDDGALREHVARAMHWGLGGAIPVAVGTWLVAAPLLGVLFGQPFVSAAPLLRIIFIAYVANGLMTLLTALVVARHHYALQAWASAAVLLGNVVLNALLLPRWGMAGAAVATAVATTLGALVLMTEAWRARCVGAVFAATLRSVLACVPMVVLVPLLVDVNLGLAIVAGAVAYMVVYLLVGGLGPGGARAAWRFVQRRGRAEAP
ncbi:MAG: oligosaccharide flippase family protein [Pseudomonadota bacterium]